MGGSFAADNPPPSREQGSLLQFAYSKQGVTNQPGNPTNTLSDLYFVVMRETQADEIAELSLAGEYWAG